VWVRSAAIRPIPGYAQLAPAVLSEVEEWIGRDEAVTEARLNEVFERFEVEQPVLAEHVGTSLGRLRDDMALALGYFLTLVVWLSFDRAFGSRVGRLDELSLRSVEEAFSLDEELRGADPAEAVESDDVVAMEQPHVLQFINDHIDAALDAPEGPIDVDAVHRVYRLVLVEVLALSYAVVPPAGTAVTSSEVYA
jgi:hypothetical protein